MIVLNRLSVSLLIILCWTSSAVSAEKTAYIMPADVKKIVKKYTVAKTQEKAKEALKELKAAQIPQDVMVKIGKSRYLKKVGPFQRALTKLKSPFRNTTNPTRVKAIIKLGDEWKALADDALTYIFDNSKYAVPAKAMTGWISGRDIQPNQGIVEGKVELTIEKWNKLAADFGSMAGHTVRRRSRPGGGGFGKKVKKEELKEPSKIQIPVLQYDISEPTGVTTMAKRFGRSYASFRTAWKSLEFEIALAQATGYQPKKIVVPSLPLAVSALCAGKLKDAVTYAPKAGTNDGKLYGLFVTHYLFSLSLAKPKTWSKMEHDALRVNNLYRMSLGLHPMLHDEKLYQCAKNHSLYQKKNGLGHFQNSKEMRTVRDRSRKAGYTAGVTENCSSGSLKDAIWSWRSDAGHHRNLIRGQSQVVGISTAGYPTHNTGYRCQDAGLQALFKLSY